jgi:hypothetical protein
MTPSLGRLTAWLVEPAAAPAGARQDEAPSAAGSAGVRSGARPPALDLALLAGPGDAHPLGAALALRLTRGVAVLGLWTGQRSPAPVGPGALATPATRRLAASLTARGLTAAATGRLVVVPLAGDQDDAAALAERLVGAVPGAPVVLAVGGPRGGAWDRLLAARDLVLVHARDTALAELTVVRLEEQGVNAVAHAAAPAGLARGLARAGLALPGAAPRLPFGARA